MYVDFFFAAWFPSGFLRFEVVYRVVFVWIDSFQATKGARWMPWGRGPMKDVVSDETPGGAAIKL